MLIWQRCCLPDEVQHNLCSIDGLLVGCPEFELLESFLRFAELRRVCTGTLREAVFELFKFRMGVRASQRVAFLLVSRGNLDVLSVILYLFTIVFVVIRSSSFMFIFPHLKHM
jgi:hypothetical protein